MNETNDKSDSKIFQSSGTADFNGTYNFRQIEKDWQQKWKESGIYHVSNSSDRPKCYVLDMFPYPSGTGLHVGHPLGYIASDIYARYKRLKGFNVLHPMGYDSFGLPAEQYALETGQHPAVTTENNINTFRSQLDNIGFSFDWSREVRTSDPKYYKWTQWIFLQIFNSWFDRKANKARRIHDLIKIFETEGSSTINDQRTTIMFSAQDWKNLHEAKKQEILMEYRLAYSAFGEVNWCEALGTVLANDEVINGVSERGGHPVEKKKMRQWYLRITAYAERLLLGLETVDFSDAMKEMQKNWIGKSEGAEVEFILIPLIPSFSPGGESVAKIEAESGDLIPNPSPSRQRAGEKETEKTEAESGGEEILQQQRSANVSGNSFPPRGEGWDEGIQVYTTRPDTIFGVDLMVLAPEHELVNLITTAEQQNEIDNYLTYVKSRSERERLSEVKQITGAFTGSYALNPFDGRKIPVWISEYVLAGYGTGAIMAVPCSDQRDFNFAKHFNIPITNIIGEHYNGEEANPTKEAILTNSGFLTGMLMKDAIPVVLQKIDELGIGKRQVNYKMRDAGFSRQRYWGEPFPIVYKNGVAYAVNKNQLPVELPHVESYSPGPEGEGPLANIKEWVQVDLTPVPSPKERGEERLKEKTEPGLQYMTTDPDMWKNLKPFARENRKQNTEAEDLLWQNLRNRNINNCKFRRQHAIGGFIVDFVCIEKKLVIEVDGHYHDDEEQKKYDNSRTVYLNEQGFAELRFSNEEVIHKISNTLSKIRKALYVNPPLSGRGVRGEVFLRETNTMPGYAGSSWYFLRYMDPHNDEVFADRKVTDYWNQVDVYVGGTEHAVGHLLYSRLWAKVLFDLGFISFDEPFKKLVNQGMIQGSSRFVYRLLPTFLFENEFSMELSDKELTPIFISDIYYKSYQAGKIKAIDLLLDISKKFSINSEFINKHEEILLARVLSIHIDVNLVDGVELDIEAFRKWKPEFANSILICEDGSVNTPLSPALRRDREGQEVRYICGVEVEKMSKSKYNTVNPNEIIDKYGADTFRMYEMFLGPVEQSKPWDTKGIEGVHRFLKKLWRLFYDEQKGKIWNEEKPATEELKILHRTIKKIEEDTERFSYNTAVSAFMVCVNELTDIKCHKKQILEPLLILLSPYAPHIAEELYQLLHNFSSPGDRVGEADSILNATFPVFDAKYLVESSKEYPISINGKMRTTINLQLDAAQEEVEKIVLSNEIVKKWTDGKSPKKIIFVKNKMVNVVV